jgi:hypothetical protein
MFDKNKMLNSQPTEEDAEDYREMVESEELAKKARNKQPKKKMSNRGRRKRPPTVEEIQKQIEDEHDEFKDFRALIDTPETKIKFELEQIKALKKAQNTRKKKNPPPPQPKEQQKKNPPKVIRRKAEEYAFDLSDIDMDASKSYFYRYQDGDVKNSPGLYILVVDQTFSMKGKSMDYLKESLKKLLKIIPKGSYYQLIGFHTFFTMYNQTPVEYNQENYMNSIDQIDKMKPEGLTNIYDPLFEIYFNGRYNHINLPRFIILLTDGQVNNTEECLDLIEKNSSFFNLHIIGIGEYINQDFIRRAGYLGKGGYDFVKDLSNLEKVLCNSIENLMRDYLSDVFIFLTDIYPDITKRKVLTTEENNRFIKQDEVYFMAFNTHDKIDEEAIEIRFNYNYRKKDNDEEDKDKLNNQIKFMYSNYNYSENEKTQESIKLGFSNVLHYFIRNLPEGNELMHLFIRNLLQNSESVLSPIYQQEADICTKYQILCSFSELHVTEDFRNKEEKEEYENNKPKYKSGLVIKKNIRIESFKHMDVSMDYYNIEFNYKLDFGSEIKNEIQKVEDEEESEEEEDENAKEDKEWYKKKKEILAQTEEINKNVEKLNKEEEGEDNPMNNMNNEEKKDDGDKKSKKSKSKKSKSKKKEEDKEEEKKEKKEKDEDKEKKDEKKKKIKRLKK